MPAILAPIARRLRRVWSDDDSRQALDWLCSTRRAAIHTDISHLTVSEWAEKKRILPQGLTALPGPYRWEVTPYLREIADCLSASSLISEVYVEKGAQVGYTVGVLENWIGYVIDVEPGPMMMISADADMAEQSVELRVNRMLETAGIAGKIASQSTSKHNKATGDTARKKEFPGGFLLAVGPRSGSKLRSFSIQDLAGDEMDGWPVQIGGLSRDAKTAAEGDPWILAKRRTDSYEAIRKILGGSTPLILQSSRIHPLYLQGDQRKYHVPCKSCGTMQPLEWRDSATGEYRLKYDRDETGRLIWESVRYVCPHCGAEWRNTDKAFFLPRGEWRPTAVPIRPGVRSYHISSLYSPIGMRTWESICEEWIAAQGDDGKLRAFRNTVLGEPYEERGEAPDYQRIMLRREGSASDYSIERIDVAPDGSRSWVEAHLPAGARILTLGADVQHDRIECELVAWGRDKESWSVGYHVLPGDTSDLSSPAWRGLTEILSRPTHGGLPLSLALVDSSDQAPTVYAYCDGWTGGVAPLKGGYRDRGGAAGRTAFALRKVDGHLCQRIDLDESYLKQEFYDLAKRGPADRPRTGDELPAGYVHLPAEYDRRHYEMLFAEDRVPEIDRYGRMRYTWHKRGRNEALDCRAYALGALYVLAAGATATRERPTEVDWTRYWDMLDPRY